MRCFILKNKHLAGRNALRRIEDINHLIEANIDVNDVIELVALKNNPDGALTKPVLEGKTIYDHAYYGPQVLGIPLMNAGELLKMDPYEEVAQQGQVPPLSPAYVLEPTELDEHVPDSIDYPDDLEDGEEDPKEDPSKEHEPKDDDEDPEEDPHEEHEPEDEDTKEPYKGSDETEPFEEDETDAPLGHRAAIIRMRDEIPEEDMPPQRRFVINAPPPGYDVADSSAAAAARAPRSQYDFVDTVEAG
nr:pyridoxal phosphate-dependent transferase [Tanacetum cinerariifolium]